MLGLIVLLTSAFATVNCLYRYITSKRVNLPKNTFSVCIVGAGFSGICLGIKLKKLGIKFQILEKSANLGGVWYDNKYPGCGCDIPSHLYSYSFAPNPYWSQLFPPQAEILAYLQNVVAQYELNIDFNQHVQHTVWDPSMKAWTIETAKGHVFVANALVQAAGTLHVPYIPEIDGQFFGDMFHSAEWKESCELHDKYVAVVGTGASAVQIIPSVVDYVKRLTVFQRTPCWTLPKNNYFYNWLIKSVFAYVPFVMMFYRWFLFIWYEGIFFTTFRVNSLFLNFIRRKMERHINASVRNSSLKAKLLPNFHPGCKRITPSDTYLQAYNNPNVEIVSDQIAFLDKAGIVTIKGDYYPVDTIIWATGFDIFKTFFPYTITSEVGEMQKVIGDTPSAYLGLTYPGFPNFFYLLGPNTQLGHNSVVWMIECQANYIVDCLSQMIRNGIRSAAVKQKAHDKFRDWTEETMKNKVFFKGCASWYRNEEDINFTLWPTHCSQYWWMTLAVNLADYDCN